jgi:hypothetical protein
MPTETALPKDHPLLNAWERYKQTEEFANNRKWAKHSDALVGALWSVFAAGYKVGMAQSTCYVADAESLPQSVTFNNGRVVTLHQASDGYPFLEVECVSVDGTGLKVRP